MTINEEKQLRNYITGLVKEAIMKEDINDLMGMYDGEDGPTNEPDWEEDDEDIAGIESDEEYDDYGDEKYDDYEDEDDAGIMARVHHMFESMARDAVKEYLAESKGGKKYNKPGSKRKGKKGAEKKGNKDKTISAFLNSDGVNAAAYAYKLYGAKTPSEKAAARSKLYKKAKGKKNDTGVPYKFNSKELSRLQNYSKDKTLK